MGPEINNKIKQNKIQQDCKKILSNKPKQRCPQGRLQKGQGSCRPKDSFCKDSSEYNN